MLCEIRKNSIVTTSPSRQKVHFFSPRLLIDRNIPVFRIVQRAGDVVVLHPRTFHAGYNPEKNFANATNFLSVRKGATPADIQDFVSKIRYCECAEGSNMKFEEGFTSMFRDYNTK